MYWFSFSYPGCVSWKLSLSRECKIGHAACRGKQANGMLDLMIILYSHTHIMCLHNPTWLISSLFIRWFIFTVIPNVPCWTAVLKNWSDNHLNIEFVGWRIKRILSTRLGQEEGLSENMYPRELLWILPLTVGYMFNFNKQQNLNWGYHSVTALGKGLSGHFLSSAENLKCN